MTLTMAGHSGDTFLATDMEDEDLVDWSIPSTPVDGVIDTEDATEPMPEASHRNEGNGDATPVKEEVVKEETTPLREIGEDTPGVVIEEDADKVDERQCRICFLGVEEEPEMGRLISPCLCAGSMRYCHVKCLQAWRGTGTNAKAFMECPQCHHQYRLRRTVVSGLATSRTVLMLATSILFFMLALMAGEMVIILVSSSALFASLLLPSDIPVRNVMDALEGEAGSPVFVITGGGTFMYEVVSSAIGTAIDFADMMAGPADAEWTFMGDLALEIGLRFVLGLALLGSLSFISLLFSLSLFAPLQIANHLRGAGWLGNLGGRRRNNAGNQGVGQAIALVVILVGAVNTIVQVYDAVKGVTQRILMYVETQILEVNPEERRQARERARAQVAQPSWRRRWWEERRWRRMAGWYELGVRGWLAVRDRVRAAGRA